MNLLTAFKIHSDIFAKWSNDNNKQLRIIMARSYTFVINIALESIYRAVLEKVIKYRTEVENTCLQQLQDELNGSYSLTDNVNTPIDPSLSDLGVTSASPLAGNSLGLPRRKCEITAKTLRITMKLGQLRLNWHRQYPTNFGRRTTLAGRN